MVVEVGERNHFATAGISTHYCAFLFFRVVRGRCVFGVVVG
jgi:hypothetical protein